MSIVTVPVPDVQVETTSEKPSIPEFWPAKPGQMKIWYACRNDLGEERLYSFKLVETVRSEIDKYLEKAVWEVERIGADGEATYHITETIDETGCDCVAFRKYGHKCNKNRGCIHLRILRALRDQVFPGDL